MRFRDLSQSATECSWDQWKCIIRNMLDEFNEDVFNGRGCIYENQYWECLYLLLEPKRGCLYIFLLLGNEIALRLFRHKIEKVTLALVFVLRQPGQENFVGGFRITADLSKERYSLMRRVFQATFEEALRRA